MIRVVVALRSEARPLIEVLELSRVEGGSLPRLFEGAGVALVVSGIGKAAAAAAVAGLAEQYEDRPDHGWINIGLAGHRSARLGTVFEAAAVRDATTRAEWRLPAAANSPFDDLTVVTVERPELAYPDDVLYDMEAAGFVAAAGSLAGGFDRLRVIKIVSDNLNRSVEHLTAGMATELIASRVEAVVPAILALRGET